MKAEIQPEDLEVLLPIIKRVKPRIIVEIGTYMGGSAKLWKDTFDPLILVTIDIRKMASVDFAYYLSGLSSQDPKVVEHVKSLIGNDPIDMLFIDGSHLYEDVKKDFELYSPLVKEGGLIVFHDILYRNAENDVPTFWKEIKRRYNYIEIAQNNNTTGVGVITMNKPYERTEFGNVT